MQLKTDFRLGFFDGALLFGSFLVALVCVYLLFQEKLLRDFAGFETKGKQNVGEIVNIDKDVRRRIGSSLAWFPALEKETLYEDDSIFTGENSEAQVQLKDGASIGISSNSLVILRKTSDQLILDLQVGRVIAKVSEGKKVQLVQNGEVAVVESAGKDSTIKFQRTKSGSLSVTSLSGKAELRIKDQGKKITPTKELKIEKSEPIKEFDLSSALRSPILSKKVWVEGAEGITFEWESIAQNVDRRILIDSSDEFKKPLIEEEVFSGAFTTKSLKNEGTYFWKIQNKNKSNKWEDGSRIGEFVLINKRAPGLIYPFDNLKFTTLTDNQLTLKFEWEEKRGVNEYLFQMSKDKDFSKVEYQEITKVNHLIKNDLITGQYYWRVKAEGTTPISHIWSNSYSFIFELQNNEKPLANTESEILPEVDKIPTEAVQTNSIEVENELVPESELNIEDEINANELDSKVSAVNLKPPIITTKEIELSLKYPEESSRAPNSEIKPLNSPNLKWKEVEGAMEYYLEFSRDKSFKQIDSKFNVKNKNFKWEKPIPGESFWRVAAKAENAISQFSEIGNLKISLPSPHIFKNRKLTQVIENPSEIKTKDMRYSWEWEAVPGAEKYEILISRSKDFSKENLVRQISREPSAMMTIKPGSTFVKVKTLSGKIGSSNEYSKVSQIDFKNLINLSQPQTEMPDDGLTIINFGESANLIPFSWSKVKNAKIYRVQLSKNKDFKGIILDEEISENQWVVSSNPYQGRIFWRIRAEYDDQYSSWSPSKSFLIQNQ